MFTFVDNITGVGEKETVIFFRRKRLKLSFRRDHDCAEKIRIDIADALSALLACVNSENN